MARRNPKYRFLINTDEDNLEVHDLDSEEDGCQIDEILASGNAKYLIFEDLASLERWLDDNPEYDGCEHCLEEYHSK